MAKHQQAKPITKPAARCALYLRVSTEQQVEGNSLRTQKAGLLGSVKARGYEVTDLYIDAGFSGKNTNRPELQRLLADAERRLFDLVLVTKLDRISRSLKDLRLLLNTLRDCGVDFAAVDQEFDTSVPVGELTLNVLGSFAQFERELLIERTKEGHLQRLHKSDWSCGPAPLGYRKEDGRLVEVPEEVGLVRRIFSLYLELGSLRAVTNQLNAEGAKTRKGNAWYSNVVRGVLMNPVYTGANVYGRYRKGDTRLRPRSEWTVVPGMRKPIVDEATYQAVQETLRKAAPPRRHAADARARSFPLAGKVRCEKCGSPMYGAARKARGRLYRYYKCSGNVHRGRAFCEGTSVRAEKLEERMATEVAKDSIRAHATAQVVEAPAPGEQQSQKQREQRNAAQRAKHRMEKLFELYEAGEIGKPELRERMVNLVAERERFSCDEVALVSVSTTQAVCGGTASASSTQDADWVTWEKA